MLLKKSFNMEMTTRERGTLSCVVVYKKDTMLMQKVTG